MSEAGRSSPALLVFRGLALVGALAVATWIVLSAQREAARPGPAAPAPVPAPAPEPAPAPAPAAANGKILVSGEFSSAKVVGAAGSFSPGSVPPGLYTVSITLTDGTQTAVRNVVVDAGGSVSITCKVAFGGCKKQ
ncbi:MAG TPA: hypothetical protein PLA94_29155 [Myxococcota bacterium]|nr:hypothetical protein [Myxococcota bacterium]